MMTLDDDGDHDRQDVGSGMIAILPLTLGGIIGTIRLQLMRGSRRLVRGSRMDRERAVPGDGTAR